MIAAVALYAGLVLADKPYKIVWDVNYGGAIPNVTYSRRFKQELPAMKFYLAAPMCAEKDTKYPCVSHIDIFIITTTDDKKAKR